MASHTRILVIGDSHVARLSEFLLSTPRDYEELVSLDMGLGADIVFHGVGGRTTAKMGRCDLQSVRDLDPNVIILMVGGNDLCDSHASPLRTASDIHDLAVTLVNMGRCRHVFACSIPPRATYPDVLPPFPNRVFQCNNILRDLLMPEEEITYWKIHGLHNPAEPIFLWDDIHFNSKGNYKLYRGIRGAVISALRGNQA